MNTRSGYRKVNDFLERVESYIEPEPMSGCHLWIGGRNGDGYGVIALRNRHGDNAHCVAYELATATEVPAGYEVDHLCRNRACVNPAHLEAVTRRVNVQRAHAATPRKTHCLKGHRKVGGRCRECGRANWRRWVTKKVARFGTWDREVWRAG